MKKLYLVSNTVTVTEETQVEAKSYEEAVDIYFYQAVESQMKLMLMVGIGNVLITLMN